MIMANIYICFIVFAILFLERTCSFGPWSHFTHPNLRYYETLDASQLRHRIVKRGVAHSTHPLNTLREVNFSAMGREFRLILNRRRGLLHPHFNAFTVDVAGKETRVDVDHSQFLEGRVFGERWSLVTAHLDDGHLTATIHILGESYYVEPAWRHLPGAGPDEMLVYRASDVQHSWDHPPGATGEGSTEHRVPLMDYVKEGNDTTEAEDEDDDEAWYTNVAFTSSKSSKVPHDLFPSFPNDEDKLPSFFEADLALHFQNVSSTAKRRVKRQQAEAYNFNGDKTRCPLLLVADHRFFKEMGGSNYKITVNYLISLIDRVDKIYDNTEWRDTSDNGGFRGMGFVIKKILVHQEWTPVASSQVHYNMQKDSWDVRNLLEVFSREYSHKDYCLAHLFTDIKFEGGILGLAYVGSPRRNSVGGICTPEYFKNGHTLYLNSGLSSSRNHYGQRVITREADLVTAHEFGHNWGSEHDPDRPECSPGASQGGSYLMYTYSVSGYDINNKKFSPCSLRAIRAVLVAKSSRCFTEPEESYCGNQRVEGQEECDAGLVGQDDVDTCCDKHCQLRSGAVCSDKNSPCCQHCQFMNVNIKCREEQRATCEKVSRCTGTSAICPKAESMPDGTPCIEKGQCKDGKCLPYCETQHMQSCMCDIVENACKRCCRKHLNDTCFPIEPIDILHSGTPCIHGFCNEGKCEKTVQDVVERFWDIIEDINMNTVLMFLRDNIVGTVLVVSVLVWLPASCVFALVDRRNRSNYQKYVRWYYSNELVHPTDSVRVIVSKRTRVHTSSHHQNLDVRHRPEGAETRPSPLNAGGSHCNPHSHHFASPL